MHAPYLRPILFIALFGISLSVFAQTSEVNKRSHQGIFVQVVQTSQKFKNDLAEAGKEIGYAIGGYQHFDLGARWQLRMGAAFGITHVDETDYSPIFGEDIDSSFHVDPYNSWIRNKADLVQLHIPVNIRCKLLGSENHLYVAGGVEARFALNTNYDVTIQESGTTPRPLDHSAFFEVRSPLFFGQLEAGYEMLIGKHKANISALLKYGLSSQFKVEGILPDEGPVYNIVTAKPLDIGISLGWVF